MALLDYVTGAVHKHAEMMMIMMWLSVLLLLCGGVYVGV